MYLIYQTKSYESQFKNYAVGIGTQRAHWDAGRSGMQRTLAHPELFVKPWRTEGVATHDIRRAHPAA